LRLGRLTVVDSTALQWRQRRSLLGLGRACGAPVAALVFDVDAATCKRRNLSRKRRVPEDVIDLHRSQLLRVLQTIFSEGFDAVRILDRVADEQVEVGAEG
ncbi:MAG TPA: AAA family ATPase, partial [Steroidobacteraceae bacterium]|nr:AAA family ATPase [Steroidobacteraceae bacterium]